MAFRRPLSDLIRLYADENDLIDAVEFFRGLIRVGRAE